jgi:hypothetical protein
MEKVQNLEEYDQTFPRPEYVSMNPRANPVFVTGFFRSGTSLLYALLNGHPQIALMYECNVWEGPERLSQLRFRRNWLERQEFFNQALSRHRLIFGRSLRGLEGIQSPDDLYRTFAGGRNASFWGEKSPLYGPRLLKLGHLYPQGCFILIWRDPVEIYRSVLVAGRTARFFRRAMLSRLIFCQERMIRQAAELKRAGLQVHHVTYDDLVDRTADVCREICGFLGIEFDERMLDLAHVDLSAVYPAQHHDHLRRGLVERRQFAEQIVSPSITRKLQRFRTRWSRLLGQEVRPWEISPSAREPAWGERFYHQVAGRLLFCLDQAKRACFEFLPLPWLLTYRQMKKWFISRTDLSVERPSLGAQLRKHWITILISLALLIGTAQADLLTGPTMTFGPFYVVPVVLLALIINRGWGTVAALICAIVWSATGIDKLLESYSAAIFLWNTVMRFVMLQFIAVLIDRMRIEAASRDPESS